MPRQAHGRPVLRQPASKGRIGPKKSNHSAALNAFATAIDEIGDDNDDHKGHRTRQLDIEPKNSAKRRKGASFDNSDEDDDSEEVPPRKRLARGADNDLDDPDDVDDVHEGVNEDEDEEIDSDEAFGESDNEALEVTAVKKQGGTGQPEGDSNDEVAENGEDEDDDLSSLGSEAIDLATALDQWEESDDAEDQENTSENEIESENDSFASFMDTDYSDDDIDGAKTDALRDLIDTLQDKDTPDGVEKASMAANSTKVSLQDLGLTSIQDNHIAKAVKLLKREKKNETRPQYAKKLSVPLPARQQAQIDRNAAYGKARETLERWTETVKHNRRAEHLQFPLLQTSDTQGLARDTITPITATNASTELEATVLSIMEESGLGPNAPRPQLALSDVRKKMPSKSELRAMRKHRELQSQEDAKAKRIKKIKSKAYHRVHRKSEQRQQIKEIAALEAALGTDGELPLDEQEQEDLNRQRALARVSGRHKESKWAKRGSQASRALWDDEFKMGLKERALRDMELRRRIEGKGGEGGDGGESEVSSEGDLTDDLDSDEDPDADRKRILREIDALENDKSERYAHNLLKMPFMQRAEARQKAENDAAIKELRKQLDPNAADADSNSSEAESINVGRRTYGTESKRRRNNAVNHSSVQEPTADHAAEGDDGNNSDNAPSVIIKTHNGNDGENLPGTNPWDAVARSHQATSSSRRKKTAAAERSRAPELDLTHTLIAKPVDKKSAVPLKEITSSSAKTKSRQEKSRVTADGAGKGKAAKNGNPMANGVASKATAADPVEDDTSSSDDSDADSGVEVPADNEEAGAEFAAEKAALVADEGDKVVDETLPGWGHWVGSGVSKRDSAMHSGRWLRTIAGVKPSERKDKALERVMINERVMKKTSRYLTDTLPHPFESRAQYERSLRMPVGEEWTTKQTFQDATKPRVLVKRGEVILPMVRPIYK